MTRMATPTTTKIEGQGNPRIPPHDLEAEMSLLGSMMLSREAIEMAVPILGRHEAQRLYLPDHQELYAVLVDLYDQAKPIDLVVVKDELQRRRKLEAVGGENYLLDLVQSVGSWVHAEHYAAIVRDKSLLRDLIACAGRMIEAAYEHTDQAREILDRAEKTLFEVTERRITQQAVSLGDMLSEVYRLIESGAGAQVTGVPTGFIELDEISCGLQPGELIIVAARPSMGKTALGLNIAERMAVDERLPTVFFSMEMGRQQVAQRILCARGRVDSHKMRRGMLSEGEIAQLGYVCQALEGAPLLIDDTPGMSLLELRAKVRRLRMQKKVACVLIDYLQLMHASGKESRQLEIAYISRGLKALARELHIPVVAMAQLNRATEAREGHRPRMSDLRESGAIEQDADVVMLLHREEYYRPQDLSLKGQAELIIAKQRNGPTGTIKLHFNKQLTRFDNLSVAPEQAGGRGDPDEAPF
jgi:replicative DNA helicase